MLELLKHKLAIFTGKALLFDTNEVKELELGKRIASIVAGAYIFQKGIRNIHKSPVISLQEVILGGFLLYNGSTGIDALKRKPKEPADVRRNQIQGNDPDSVPAFV